MDANLPSDNRLRVGKRGEVRTAACVSDLLVRHGVTPRHHATQIAQICAISVSQARRKLRGAVWLFAEVQALCHHYGETLSTAFGDLPSNGHIPAASTRNPGLTGTLLLEGLSMPVCFQPGPPCAKSPTWSEEWLAAQRDGEWTLGSSASLDRVLGPGPRFSVAQLMWTAPLQKARARIAVLDDDPQAAEALSDWFNELGFVATGYTQAEALLDAKEPTHDVYVVDWILGNGQTAQPVVEHIRRHQPHAPIFVLTGRLRDGQATEEALAAVLRNHAASFFEKPVRATVLTAAIQSSLDRLRSEPRGAP